MSFIHTQMRSYVPRATITGLMEKVFVDIRVTYLRYKESKVDCDLIGSL